jgi:carbamoyltransferase
VSVNIVGISALYHDAAAAVVRDGVVVAAAQEERFSRVKHDARMPVEALRWCLEAAEVGPDGIDLVAFYDKPLLTFGRVLRSYVDAGPRGLRTFPGAMAGWARTKLWTPYWIERAVTDLGYRMPGRRVLFAEHHESHAAAAFYPSPYESACVLTFDGVGEWATSSIGHGVGRRLDLLAELRFPASIGLLYSAFTLAAGFRVNSGEYKLMGLAPFGEPVHVDAILGELVDLHDDGSFTVDMSWFDHLAGRRMTGPRFHERFGPDREPDAPITQRECDLARSVQEVVEEIVLRMARHAHELTGERRAVLAGGVALNGVAMGRLAREGPFDEIWVQPAAGDAGSALGCALWAWHEVEGRPRSVAVPDGMAGALLGPAPDADEVAAWLAEGGRPATRIADPGERADRVAELLAAGAVVAVVQGGMELGPRALGSRSILADPRSGDAQQDLNVRVKRREGFRPFAPAVLAERAADWFDISQASPYMGLVVPVRGAEAAPADEPAPVAAGGPERPAGSVGSVARPEAAAARPVDLAGRLARTRSPLPAVTHVDGSARVQTVDAARFPWFHRLLVAFEARTGCPVLLNTSFNVRGEPIVADHVDAYRCFMTTEIDWLVLGDSLLAKADQPVWEGGAPATVPD